MNPSDPLKPFRDHRVAGEGEEDPKQVPGLSQVHTQRLAITHGDNFRSSFNPWSSFLDCGRKHRADVQTPPMRALNTLPLCRLPIKQLKVEFIINGQKINIRFDMNNDPSGFSHKSPSLVCLHFSKITTNMFFSKYHKFTTENWSCWLNKDSCFSSHSIWFDWFWSVWVLTVKVIFFQIVTFKINFDLFSTVDRQTDRSCVYHCLQSPYLHQQSSLLSWPVSSVSYGPVFSTASPAHYSL